MSFSWWMYEQTGSSIQWNTTQQQKGMNCWYVNRHDSSQRHYAKWKEAGCKSSLPIRFYIYDILEKKKL